MRVQELAKEQEAYVIACRRHLHDISGLCGAKISCMQQYRIGSKKSSNQCKIPVKDHIKFFLKYSSHRSPSSLKTLSS